jgi:hypothetical protein
MQIIPGLTQATRHEYVRGVAAQCHGFLAFGLDGSEGPALVGVADIHWTSAGNPLLPDVYIFTTDNIPSVGNIKPMQLTQHP